jgi:L-seryl-tRNA(Ser) seleniumtransferase
MRALRVDKLTYAALEGTLVEHLTGRAADAVPVTRMASMPVEAIAVRAQIVAAKLCDAGFSAAVVDGFSTIGGGSAPGSQLPTRLVTLTHPSLSADELEGRLRRAATPVVARIEDDRVMLDLRTVDPRHDEGLRELIVSALGE